MKKKIIPVLLVIAFANVLYFVVFSHKRLPLDKTVLYDEQNQIVSLEGYQHTVRIISFFQTWCGDCRREMVDLKQLQQRFNGRLKIIMITDEPFELINEMKMYLNVDFIFLRSDKKLKEMRIHQYPTTFLLDKKGKVILVKKEGKDWYSDKMIKTIEPLLR